MATPVIFRVWNDTGDVIAFFPEIPSDTQGYECMSYMHIGQHGGAAYSKLLCVTRLAKPEEYKDLLTELEGIGYNDLVIKRRYTQAMFDKCRETARGYK